MTSFSYDFSASGAAMFESGEFVEFSVKAADPNYMSKTGRILLTGDLSRVYGFVDEDGDNHNMRSVSRLLAGWGHTWIAAVIPGFVRVQLFVLHYLSNKF